MTEFLQGVLSGLTIGSIYALVALGFSFIYASIRIVNFAQGEWAMIGGMAAATIAGGSLGLAGAALLSPVVGGTLGFVVYRLFVAPSRSRDVLTVSLIFVGMSLVLQGFALWLWGPEPKGIAAFGLGPPIIIAGAILTRISLLVICVGVALMLVIMAVLKLTKSGRAIVASAENPEAAALSGINVRRVVMTSFVLSGCLAGLAGFLVTPITSMSYQGGLNLTLQAFAASALGGLRSPAGSVAGGLALGLVNGLSLTYLGGSGLGQTTALAAALGVLLVAAPRLQGTAARPEETVGFELDVAEDVAHL